MKNSRSDQIRLRRSLWTLALACTLATALEWRSYSLRHSRQESCADTKDCSTELFAISLPPIPRTWDDERLGSLELPLPTLHGAKKVHVSSDYYYRIPVRPLYKNYPVYAPGREPVGYQEWLERQQPELLFDISKLHTYSDWIDAGRSIFHAPIAYNALVDPSDLKNAKWYAEVRPPVAKDGTIPFLRYGIREGGRVEVGILSCATCHSRVMSNGETVDGAQGNFRYNAAIAWSYRTHSDADFVHRDVRLIYGTPWIKPDPQANLYRSAVPDICRFEEALPAGVIARNGTSPLYPTQVPSLIGLRDRLFLDATGQVQHRNIGDLMRYMALAQGIDFISKYGSFIPNSEGDPPQMPPPSELHAQRYSDAELFALALYIYSLKPPPNPNLPNELASRGKRLFTQSGCTRCHTPPLYTNNMLMAVDGFEIPPGDAAKFRVMEGTIGTDAGLTLKTRRGTGYYKVPSLRGLWYREMLSHSGYVKTLEDWFDSKRTKETYIPTGFRRPGEETFAVKGHPYGLTLTETDRKALIAFLRTLN
jgi:hypothetical protein